MRSFMKHILLTNVAAYDFWLIVECSDVSSAESKYTLKQLHESTCAASSF